MSAERPLMAFALAFEETYRDDDWSRLEPFFGESSCYEVRGDPYSCRIEGTSAILEALRRSIDGFDRRCEVRQVELTEGPEVEPDPDGGARVKIAWSARYELEGAPDLRFEGRSTAHIVDDCILHLVDEYRPEQARHVERWIRDHAPNLDFAYR